MTKGAFFHHEHVSIPCKMEGSAAEACADENEPSAAEKAARMGVDNAAYIGSDCWRHSLPSIFSCSVP